MHLLTEQQLAELSSLDSAIYSTLLRTVERHPAAAFLVDAASGFFFFGADVVGDDPYVVDFRLRFRQENWPGLDGNFNPSPDGVHFYFFTSIGMSPQAGRFTMWPMLLTDYPSESAFLAAASEFVSDWLTGQTQVEIATANRVPYKWTVRQRGRELWSHRCFLYPFWGRKAVEIRACGEAAPPRPGQDRGQGQ